MSNRYGSSFDDEPIIGAPPPVDEPIIGVGLAREPSEPTIGYPYDEPESVYDDEAGEYGWDTDYYREDELPARQPMFYVFLFLTAVVGGILVFLVFSLVSGRENVEKRAATEFAVQIDSPTRDERLEINQQHEVIVQASATEPLRRFELFLGTRAVDALDVTDVPADNRYRVTLRFSVAEKGTYELFVRVFAVSGLSKDSERVRIVAIEPVGGRPQVIRGRVVADATLRQGPGDTYPEAGTLRAGAEVTIAGKTRDLTWLQVSSPTGGSGWVRQSAIEPLDTLELVPVRDVTPTPLPTGTATPEPSPTATASPSPPASAPDFIPTNAVLANGGSLLRVTVSNVGSTDYNGPLVIAVGGDVPEGERVYQVSLRANGGSSVLEVPLSPPVTAGSTRVTVEVDPGNLVRELREDNNTATFVIQRPVEPPNLVITTATASTSSIDVTIRNDGGRLTSTSIVVQVQLGGETTSKTVTLSLESGQSSQVQLARPSGSGSATVAVLIDGTTMATKTVDLP